MQTLVQTDPDETAYALKRKGDEEVAELIIQGYHSAEALSKEARSTVGAAVEQAIRVGTLLNSKHSEIGHGRWLHWLKTFVPDLHVVTLTRWMKLARLKANGLGGCMEGAQSLRSCYIATGILPAPAVSRQRRAKAFRELQTDADFLNELNRLFATKACDTVCNLTDGELLSWKASDLELFSHELEPLVQLHERIQKALKGRL